MSARRMLVSALAGALTCASLAGAVAIPATLHAQPASDETRNRARALGEEGNALFDKGDYAAALDRYDRAATLVNVPTLGLKAARCLDKLGRLVEAAERYLAVTRMTLAPDALDVHKEAVKSADQERSALLARIPSVVVSVEGGAPTSVKLDGKDFATVLIGMTTPINPGAHHIEASVETKRGDTEVLLAGSADFTVEERETKPVTVVLRESAPPPPATKQPSSTPPVPAPARPGQREESWLSPRHGAGLAVLGLGVAGLAVGAGAGGAALGQKGDLTKHCGATLQCGPAFYADADSYNHLRVASSAGWIAGGVLAATGIVLVAIPNAASASSTARASGAPSVRIGPTGASLSGRF